MSQQYETEFKKKIVQLHIEEGRTIRSLQDEYGVSKASISIWVNQFRKECQTSVEAKSEQEVMLELRKLRQKNSELEKENLFLKKAAAFFAKEID